MIRIGMVGVGNISGIYLQNITGLFRDIELTAVCDLVREKAERAQAEYDIPKLYDTMEELFADPEIDIGLNLTRPYEHFDVTSAALRAGKHVYSEKPLGATWEEGKALAALAEERGLMLGGAPDTFLGAGIQTCRRLIDDGFIGRPIGAAAAMVCHGHESWHPDPAFYYQFGGGPLLDMGPYYITALVNLLGGVRAVTGVAATSFPQRTITSRPLAGAVIDVEVPTHVNGILQFDGGAVGTILTSFDVYAPEQTRLEIYGTEGTLYLPDPNGFGGPVRLLRPEDGGTPKEIPLLYDYPGNSRGLGLADMAVALETGRPARAPHAQTLHVLEVMTAIQRSSDAGRTVELETRYTPRAPMVKAVLPGVLDR